MSRVDAIDAALTSVGTKVGVGATAATSANQWGEVNVSGVILGGAQAVHGVVDLSTKGLQAVPGSTWGKALPGLGAVIGGYGFIDGLSKGPISKADYAGLVSNGLGTLAAVAAVTSAPVTATLLAGGAVAGVYQIYSTFTNPRATGSYSLEGQNYQTPSCGLTPNHRGAGFVDPRGLPATSALDQAKAQQAVHAKQTIASPAQAAKAAAQAEAARAAEINQQAQARLKRQEGVGGSNDGVDLRPLSSSAPFFDVESDPYQERKAWDSFATEVLYFLRNLHGKAGRVRLHVGVVA